MMNKLAIFIPSFNGGGAEKTMIYLCNEFADRGYDVELITLNSNGVYKKYINSNVKIIDFEKTRVLKSIIPLTSYIKRNKPDAIITAMTHVNVIAALSKLLSSIDFKLIISVHSITSKSLKSRTSKIRARFLINNTYKYAHGIVCVSDAVANDLEKNFKVNSGKVTTINNPVILPEIYMNADEKVNIESKDGEILILSVGRLEKVKNFQLLIRATKEIRNRGHNVRLLILGEGSLRDSLEVFVNNLDLNQFVSMPGFAENVYPYYINSDIFVLPSRNEGLGNVLIEAMGFGLPVIAAENSGGPDEILEHGLLGDLFENDNYLDLASKIENTIKGDYKARKKYDLRKYEIQEVADKYLRVIKKDEL